MFLDGLLRLTRVYLRTTLRLSRLSIYLVCAFLFLSFLAARSLYADVKEAAVALGRELADLPELTHDAEILHINGARLHHAWVSTPESVKQVMDRLEAHCQHHIGPLGEAFDELSQRYPAFAKQFHEQGFRSAIIRHDDAESGAVICFTDDRPTGLAELPAILTRFAETTDLSELGHFRYAYAERRAETTVVITMWTDSELNLSKMFPASGDASGNDSALVPRPPGSRRTLSAAAEGMALGVRTYESREKAATVQRFYEAWFKRHHWLFAAKDAGGIAYFSPKGHQVMLALQEADGRTYATLVEAGSPSGSPIAAVEVSE